MVGRHENKHYTADYVVTIKLDRTTRRVTKQRARKSPTKKGKRAHNKSVSRAQTISTKIPSHRDNDEIRRNNNLNRFL